MTKDEAQRRRWTFCEAVNYAVIALTCLVRRDIFLEAVLRWMAPFLAAFWMIGIAEVRDSRALSAEFSLIAARSRLVTFFTRVRFDLLRRFLTLFCLALLIADL
jgi:hypothetical protein